MDKYGTGRVRKQFFFPEAAICCVCLLLLSHSPKSNPSLALTYRNFIQLPIAAAVTAIPSNVVSIASHLPLLHAQILNCLSL